MCQYCGTVTVCDSNPLSKLNHTTDYLAELSAILASQFQPHSTAILTSEATTSYFILNVILRNVCPVPPHRSALTFQLPAHLDCGVESISEEGTPTHRADCVISYYGGPSAGGTYNSTWPVSSFPELYPSLPDGLHLSAELSDPCH
jgi:hypothetical protein